MVPWNIYLLFYNCPVFLSNLFALSSTAFELSVSLLLCVKVDFGCSWFVVQNWRFSPEKGNLLLRFEAFHWIIILSLPTNRVEPSVLIIHSDSWIFSLINSFLVPLRPLVGLRPPSKIPSFSHSASLSLLHFCLALYKTQLQKAFSLHAGALSLWHSLPQ